MKQFSILLSFVAGIEAANAAVQVTPVQDKPVELFLSSAKGSTEFPDPGQAPLGPFPYHVKWDFDVTSGGHFSDVHLLEGGMPDSIWIGFEYYERYDSNHVGSFEYYETYYSGGPPGDRQLKDSSTNSSPLFSPPWEIGSLSKSLQFYGNATRTSKASTHLRTGGKSGSKRKSLFEMNVSATGYHDLNCFDTWIGFSNWISPIDSYGITNTSIQVPNFGPVDTNGYCYAGLADNTEVDVTPQTPEKYYSFSESTTKHKLVITFGGADVTETNTTVVMGQAISLSCELVPPGPPITSFQWTIPSYAISNWVASENLGKAYEDFAKTNSTVTYYWVDGGAKRVQCDFVVKGVSLSATADFNVIRPSINWIGSIDDAVAVNTNYFCYDRFDPNLDGLTWLHFGCSDHGGEIGIVNGINFTATNIDLKGYTGDYDIFCYQTGAFSSQHCKTNGNSTHTTGTGLDNAYPYMDLMLIPLAHDSPATSIAAADFKASRNDTFQMYLMFQPTSVPSIAVPMRVVNWSWSGTGTLVGTNWTLSASSSAITANNQDTTTYGQWTSNMIHSVTITNTTCN